MERVPFADFPLSTAFWPARMALISLVAGANEADPTSRVASDLGWNG